ncbi:hypothetical protein KXD40_004971 [Peronospora effusa]|uniref:Uncharacterized protein n=1 Tax=Peronospora effusa TaxID=542832 RepID=A0A3M6VUP0_9STRA|nr:hypothetical protein DD238_001214 [Peronospora effusa]RQM18824.1 hypothetical protein DD237_002611 [Peronospora effusa]UIZ22203.1 hypothetical protein KXD40_004971 [Peronospora effusa]
MNGPTGSEKVVYTTCAGAFFGAAVGSVESVWAIPKLGAKLPKLSTQLKHLGTRSVYDTTENKKLDSDLLCIAFMQFVFAAVGCIFSTGEYLSASIRQTEDPINAGVGGALVGIVPGIVKQSMRVGVGAGVVAGAAMCAASFWQSSQETPFEKYATAQYADRS